MIFVISILTFAILAYCQPISSTAPIPLGGSVAGVVRNAATRDPIPGVQVELLGSTSTSQKTDGSGHFKFVGLKSGTYRIVVKGSGFAKTSLGTLTMPRAIQVSPGAQIGMMELLVNDDAVLSGRVFDSRKELVVNAQVQLWSRGYLHGRPLFTIVASGTTNDRGEYSLAGLGAGEYYVAVRPTQLKISHGAPARNDRSPTPADVAVFYPSELTLDSANVVTIGPAEQRSGIDLQLRELETYCVRGSLQGARQLSTISLRLTQTGPGWRRVLANSSMRASSSFHICGLAPGQFHLEAASFGEQGIDGLADTVVEVGDHDIDLGRIHLTSGLMSAGNVRLLAAESQTPLPSGMALALRPVNRAAWQGEGITTEIGRGGEFRLLNTFGTHYWLTLRNLPEGHYVHSIANGARDGTREPIQPSDGGVNVVLGRDGASITGVVITEGGDPAPDSYVVVAPASMPVEGAPSIVKVQLADQNGRFRIVSIPPGNYNVIAFSELEPGEGEYPPFVQAHLNGVSAISLDANRSQEMRLTVKTRR